MRRRKFRQPTPTQAKPGTAEKVAVLEQRYLRGEPLWHEQDAIYTLNETPTYTQENDDYDDLIHGVTSRVEEAERNEATKPRLTQRQQQF